MVSNAVTMPSRVFDRILVIGLPEEEVNTLKADLAPCGAYFMSASELRFRRQVAEGTGCVVMFSPGLDKQEQDRLKRVLDTQFIPCWSSSLLDSVELFVRARLKNTTGIQRIQADRRKIEYGRALSNKAPSKDFLPPAALESMQRQFVVSNLPEGIYFDGVKAANRIMRLKASARIPGLSRDKIYGFIRQERESRLKNPAYAGQRKHDGKYAEPEDEKARSRKEDRQLNEKIMRAAPVSLPAEFVGHAVDTPCRTLQNFVKRLYRPAELGITAGLERWAKTIGSLARRGEFPKTEYTVVHRLLVSIASSGQ